MKIGLISDIHAQLARLDCAIDILQSQGVDMILCAGDLVNRGHEGDTVVERIRAVKIPTVRGNHDVIALRNPIFFCIFSIFIIRDEKLVINKAIQS